MLKALTITIITAVLAGAMVFLPYMSTAVASNIQDDLLRALYLKVFYWRFYILVVLAISEVLLTSVGTYFIPAYRERKDLRRGVMEAMREELFENESNKLRITIFKDANWLTSLRIRTLMFTRYCWRRLQKKDCVFPTLDYKFLHVWDRIGTEYPRSGTFFYYSPKTANDCEGITGRVRQTQTSITKRDLDSISESDLNKINNGKRPPSKVKQYLKDTYSNLETLRRLNVRALHFHGEVIYDTKRGEGQPLGVLILDSIEDENPFTEDKKIAIQRYVKLLGRTL